MAASRSEGRTIIRFAIRTLAIFMAAVIAVAPASAQEERKSRNLFEFLFGGSVRSQPVKKQPTAKRRAPAKRSSSSSRASAPAEPDAPAAVEKSATARTVLVVGDFMAGGLAEGLGAVFAGNPDIVVVERSNGSSGFVRDDVYDWPNQIGPLIEELKPAAVVAMLGSNDRQQIRTADGRQQLLTEGWTTEYQARIGGFAKAIAERKVPLLWVGLPAFKQKKMLSDMLVFNDFYRQTAASVGGAFVDIWDGFVDENGAFVINGPDINGQPVRLRGGDGIILSRAGKRKAAFYVEKPLFKALGISGASGTMAPAVAPLPSLEPAGPTRPVDRTVPIALDDPNLDGGQELLGAIVKTDEKGKTAAERLAAEGLAREAAPGRADDFAMRPLPVAPAAAATADASKTSSVTKPTAAAQ